MPPRSLVYVPSVGIGHGLPDLLGRLAEGSAILCVEADPRIMALAVREGLPADPRLAIVRTTDFAAVAEALARLGTGRFRRVVEAPLCSGYRLFPALYADIHRLLEEEIATYWRNRLTLVAMGGLQVRNLFDNLALLPDASDFSALSTDLPVVVAGAGPSLEESIPVLQKLRSRFALIAVDTALPLLVAQSLRPDLIVALEAQAANLKDFIPREKWGARLACDLSAHPATTRLFMGRLHFFSSTFAPLRLFDRFAEARLLPSVFPALGSVGVAAVRAALCVTRDLVFLTGLDFSFPGSRTHARGTPQHLESLIRSTRLHAVGQDAYGALLSRRRTKVRDKRGGSVETDMVLRSYRENLRREIGGSSQRAMDIGATGLDLGVRLIGAREFETTLLNRGTRGGGIATSDAPRFSRPALQGALDREANLLERAAGQIRAAIAEKPPRGRCADILRAIDYAWVHFPDEPDLTSPDRSFLARALVAVGYYAQRLERIRRCFGSEASRG
jgi:hypothetical protein